MRIILHIGQHKTGSTALQWTLRSDRRRLRRLGVLYPNVGHLRPTRRTLAPSHNGLFQALEGTVGERSWQSLDEMRERLSAQLERKHPDTVVISAERGFLVADRDPATLDRLDDLLPGDKEVVAYLRRPDRYLASDHRQRIKRGQQVRALDDPERLRTLEEMVHLDSPRAVEVYRRQYGGVRLFDYDQVGDTVEHFYRTVLDIDTPANPPDRTNPSIPAVFTNLTHVQNLTQGPLALFQQQALIDHGEAEPVDLLGPTNRARVAEAFGPINRALGRHVGRPGFFTDTESIGQAPAGSISVAAADEQYRSRFEELLTPPDIGELRQRCAELEAQGRFSGASELFASVAPFVGTGAREWFRSHLEADTNASWTIVDNHYQENTLAR